MTADDIIAGNPQFTWRKGMRGKSEVLFRTEADGSEAWVIFKGDHHVSAAMPITPKAWRAAWHNLNGVQPGKKFRTVGDDRLAKTLTDMGLKIRDDNGFPLIDTQEDALQRWLNA